MNDRGVRHAVQVDTKRGPGLFVGMSLTALEGMAFDQRLPLWQRIALFAWSDHYTNGHRPLQPGELAVYMSTDPETGEIIREFDPRQLRTAITKAIEMGWLEKGSSLRCIVVPHRLAVRTAPHRTLACAVHEVGAQPWVDGASVPVRKVVERVRAAA